MLDVDGPAARPHASRAPRVIDGEQVGIGSGRTKKDAEQEAAREALDAARACLSLGPYGSCAVIRGRSLASPPRAPERDQAAWLQVVPRSGRGPARAGRGRGRRAERLREVERLRRDRLGGRLARSVASCARRSPTTCSSPARPSGRPTDYCEVELLFDNADGDGPARLRGALDLAAAAPRRRGPVPRQPHGRPPHRPRRAARRPRARRRRCTRSSAQGKVEEVLVVVARASGAR